MAEDRFRKLSLNRALFASGTPRVVAQAFRRMLDFINSRVAHGVRVSMATDYTHTSTGNWLDVGSAQDWDSADGDQHYVDNYVDLTSTEPVTCWADGWYNISAWAQIQGNTTGRRLIGITTNGAGSNIHDIEMRPASDATDLKLLNVRTIYLDKDDTVGVRVYQNSGGNLDVKDVRLTVVRLF